MHGHVCVCTVAKPQAQHGFTWILLILLILLTFLNFRERKGREKIKRRCLELARFWGYFHDTGLGGGGWGGGVLVITM